MEQIILCIYFCSACFYITVIAELLMFQIAESTADWNSPKTSQNISMSSYFSISKYISIVHYRNLTRKFWYFLRCRLHQHIESNAGLKGKLSFLWNLGLLMCNWTKIKSITNTETLSASPKIQLVSLFIWKLEYNFIKNILLGKKKEQRNLSSTFIYAIMICWFKMAAFIAAFYFIVWILHCSEMDCNINPTKSGSK